MWIEVMRVAKAGFRACLFIDNELRATTPYPENLSDAVSRAQNWSKETQIYLKNWQNPRLEKAS